MALLTLVEAKKYRLMMAADAAIEYAANLVSNEDIHILEAVQCSRFSWMRICLVPLSSCCSFKNFADLAIWTDLLRKRNRMTIDHLRADKRVSPLIHRVFQQTNAFRG